MTVWGLHVVKSYEIPPKRSPRSPTALPRESLPLVEAASRSPTALPRESVEIDSNPGLKWLIPPIKLNSERLSAVDPTTIYSALPGPPVRRLLRSPSDSSALE